MRSGRATNKRVLTILKPTLIILFLILISTAGFGLVQQFNNLVNQTNPFNFNLNANEETTLFIPIKNYALVQNISLILQLAVNTGLGLNNQLIGWYNLSDLNDSTQRNPAEAPSVGGATYPPKFFPGNKCKISTDGCFYMNDSNSLAYVNLTEAYNDAFQEFSISLWLNWSDTDNDGVIFERGGDVIRAISLRRDSSLPEKLTFQIVDLTPSIITARVPNGVVWDSHIVAVFNGSGIQLWFNGSIVNQTDTTGSIPFLPPEQGGHSALGRRPIGGGSAKTMRGTIDELGIWNKTLTLSDISRIYNGGAGSSYPYAQNTTINISFYNKSLQIINFSDTSNKLISLNTTYINNKVLNDSCACVGCVNATNFECDIPLTFRASADAELTINLSNSSFQFGYEVCTNEPQNTTFPRNINYTLFRTREEKTNTLVTTNGSFFFSYYHENDPANRVFLGQTVSNKVDYRFCRFPDKFKPVGNFTHTFSGGIYESRGLNRFNVSYNGTFNAYLLDISATTTNILYVLVDNQIQRIEGALFSIWRVIGGELTLVYQQISDVAGQVATVQDQEYEYFINITHPDFPTKEFLLKPVLSSYTIKLLEDDENLFNNKYSGIRYRITPTGNLFNVSGGYTRFNFFVEGSDIEYFGLNFTRHNFTCIPANCINISTNPNGGNATVFINFSQPGKFYTSLFFKKIGGDHINVNLYPGDAVVWITATRSFIQLVEDLKENLSPNQLAVISTLMMVTIIGVGSAIGLLGAPLIFLASILVFIFSLPAVGLIPPLIGLLMAISGFITVVLITKKD